MQYRNLTKNELLNISREFNLLAVLSNLDLNEGDLNKSDLYKTWIALIGGSVDSIAIDDQTIADLTILDSVVAGVKDAVLNKTEVQPYTPPETTIQTIPFEYRNYTFTLSEALPQITSVVFWGVKNGYKKVNLGRAIHIDEAVHYNVDLRVAGNYESVEVVVNAPNVDFVVS